MSEAGSILLLGEVAILVMAAASGAASMKFGTVHINVWLVLIAGALQPAIAHMFLLVSQLETVDQVPGGSALSFEAVQAGGAGALGLLVAGLMTGQIQKSYFDTSPVSDLLRTSGGVAKRVEQLLASLIAIGTLFVLILNARA